MSPLAGSKGRAPAGMRFDLCPSSLYATLMGQLTLHNLDEEVEKRLRLQAATHQRTVEEEATSLIADGVGAMLRAVAADEAMLQRRREILERFRPGEWSVDVPDWRETRAAERREAGEMDRRWRE